MRVLLADENNEIPEDNMTINSNYGVHPIVNIQIVDYAINYGQNQIIIKSVLY